MNAFETYIPTKLIFGVGEIKRLGEETKKFGDRVLVVTTGGHMEKFGILEKAMDSLERSGIKGVVFSDVEANPKTYNVDAGAQVYIENKCNAVVGLGGGSAIDAAKAIAMVTKNGGPVMDYMPGHKRYGEEITETNPIIAITTTAGTGSEATYFAVITNPETHEKPGLGSRCMMPEVSIIDPELMLSLPQGVTAQTGVDVFFHAMEAYLNRHATPYSDMVSLLAMRTVVEYLPRVLKDPLDIEARSQMAWANTLGGIAIVLSATCGLHAIGHSISGVTDIAHGRALAAAAAAFMEYTCKGDYKRYADVARILGADKDLGDAAAAEEAAGLLEKFLQGSKMETALNGAGVPENDIDAITKVCKSSMYFCMQASLMPLEEDDINKILRLSVSGRHR